MQSQSHGMTTTSKPKALFLVHRVTEDAVHIIDLSDQAGTISVTNDAEAVVSELNNEFGNKKFFYLDTMGNWDELVHDNGKFRFFRPHRS